jgi:2-amino-4-hydroxy-6-hydroxymethyldihydropteridine diphosphokinase
LNRRALVAVALGSNLGDRHANLDFAAARLAALLDDLRVSSRHETEPVGTPTVQSPYLNAAAVGVVYVEPLTLLREMQAIEAARGRERPYPNAPRTLDLDLILFGDLVLRTAELVVPHPRFRERRFVLEPLAEIAPGMVDPVSGFSVTELFRRL